MKTKRTLILAITCALLTTILTLTAKAQIINPGIIDPTNAYAGKSYSQWAAGFWQYYMSQPATNNPFHRDPLYPIASLSTGQSGPVWFVCGDFVFTPPVVSYTYTDTVPGGVALFMAITGGFVDNSGCPATTNSESELRAMAESSEDNAGGMACSIDGVTVSGLDDVLTSPYRIQSTFFDYTCPAVYSILYDVDGLTCYSNSTGIPYTIRGAVEDIVCLMVAPLSAGKHTVDVTWAFPAFSIGESWTRNLTVLPVVLTTGPMDQAGRLELTWPQTPDNYTLQTSPSLSPPAWQTTNLVITTNNGILRTTALVGATNQFFRLQLN
jgi:hypothetical protein